MLCREIFIHGCSRHGVVFPRLEPTTNLPPPAKGSALKAGSRKTFRGKATEISLASLRFGIRGSWGASNLVLPAKESELLFPLIQLRLLDPCVKRVPTRNIW